MLPDRSGTLYLTDLDAGINAFCIRYGRRGFDWRLRMRASRDRSLQSRSISRLDMRRGDPPPLKWSDLRYVFDIKEDCNGGHGVRQSQDAMGPHGAHVREVERPLALAVGELDLALRQVRARLHGQARKPGRGSVEDPSHQLVPSIKERIVNRFPIFLGGTDRAVELHQLAFELEEGGIVAGRVMLRHWVVLLSRAPTLCPREHSGENEGTRPELRLPPSQLERE